MDSNRHSSLTVIVVYKDGNSYTVNNVVKIETFFNKNSQLALHIYYESNIDGCVVTIVVYDDINVILLKGEM